MTDPVKNRVMDLIAWGNDSDKGLVIEYWFVEPGDSQDNEDVDGHPYEMNTMDPATFARMFLMNGDNVEWLYHNSLRLRITFSVEEVKEEA